MAGHDPLTLIGRMRSELEGRSITTNVQKAWLYWGRAFLVFHEGRTPESLSLSDVTGFLRFLRDERGVAPASCRQALRAVEFLLTCVMGRRLSGFDTLNATTGRESGPLILSPQQVQRLLTHLRGANWLIASLLYGSGLRLLECIRLRIRDFESERIIVRDADGRPSRETVLPERVREPLRVHLDELKLQHIRELADGFGGVELPGGLAAQSASPRGWVWQYVFPGPYLSDQRVDGQRQSRRCHVPEAQVRQALESAARKAGIDCPMAGNTLRNSFAAHLIQRGVAVTDVEQLLGVRGVARKPSPAVTVPEPKARTPVASVRPPPQSPVDTLAAF